ncbi:uncharacterized protein PHACADRAFT_212117 [Phanerochaete carnosa HHB-10118-sp]|uniref:Sensitive to high expression protein 9, mitochondrial n=1 Tax=Phanerochaete carnosa (strain HHB-10118-sp) TaxID=650164 RepID=K5VJF8_PHACS|nr:uncharacterized protein PHACADRAFT_212117 [Phanerochaete carnosa HHB-10118-sp]EKM51473.1 hypothetical protein PHACADRAFT_212117 [Phanerochaete carnosa HHB-10118-sp]
MPCYSRHSSPDFPEAVLVLPRLASRFQPTHLLDIPCDAPPPQSQENARSSSDSSAQLPKVLGVEEVKEKLRSWTESAAATIRDRADRYTAVAATTFGQLGRELNKVTGYGEIESLKRQVAEQEQHIKAAREAAHGAKTALEQAVQQRAKSQREVNDLLQRKSSWTDEDVGRFTALVRQDHLYEQSEACAKAKASRTEEEVEREFTELMRVILNRYHEEQVWSDKIRSASTYGSLTVLGLNVIVFILAIVIVEPWKRRRLAQTFEKKVEEVAVETIGTFETKYGELSKQLKDQNMLLLRKRN